MRKGLIALVFALLVSACGGTGTETTDASASAAAAAETAAPVTEVESEPSVPSSAAPSAAPDQAPAPGTAPSFDGPPAPDFELALADGTVFALTAEAKPVYMVFWAEW